MKELESENARLNKLVANQALDVDMLREISSGNFEPRPSASRSDDAARLDTADCRTIKSLNIIDEFARESLAVEIDRSINADDSSPYSTTSLPSAAHRIRALRQRPRVHLSFHLGLVPIQRHQRPLLRPRLTLAQRLVESFNGRLDDELLNSWRFDPLLEARVSIED